MSETFILFSIYTFNERSLKEGVSKCELITCNFQTISSFYLKAKTISLVQIGYRKGHFQRIVSNCKIIKMVFVF